MKLNMTIMYHELSKVFKLHKNRDVFLDWNELEMAVFWEGQSELESTCLYIGDRSMMEGWGWRHHSFIVVGDSDFNWDDGESDLIVVEGEVPLGSLLNVVQSILHRSAKLTMKMYRQLDKKNGLGPLVALFHEMTERHIYVMDENFSVLAASEPGSQSLIARYLEALQRRQGKREGFTEWSGLMGDFLEYDITHKDRNVARLFMMEDGIPFEEPDRKHLCYIGEFLQRHFDIVYEESQADLYDLHRVVRCMLKNDSEVPHSVAEFAISKLGWKKSDQYEVIVMQHQLNAQTDLMSGYICAQLERLYRKSCAVRIDDHIVCLLNYGNITEKNHYPELAYYLREGMYRAGISQRFDSFFKLYHFYRQAWIALRYNLNSSIWYTHFDDCALKYMVLKCPGEFTRIQMCHRGLLKLREYDQKLMGGG